MSIFLTSPLQKNLTKLAPDTETVSGILQFIEDKSAEIRTLIVQFGKNIETLSLQKDRCGELIGILEEAGGLTVRARNFVTTPQDAEKYRDKTKDLEGLFKTTLAKLDKYVSTASDNGVNLLNGGSLVTKFDEKNENRLTTNGIALDSQTLGIRQPDFSNMLTVQNARIDIMNAIDMAVTLRNIIASDIADIQSGLDFSVATINTANDATASFANITKLSEAKSMMTLNPASLLGDDPLAEPAQQEILNSFAASPNMEEI